jgi:hypothetical protein
VGRRISGCLVGGPLDFVAWHLRQRLASAAQEPRSDRIARSRVTRTVRHCIWLTAALLSTSSLAHADMLETCDRGPPKRESSLWFGFGAAVRDTADAADAVAGDLSLDAAITLQLGAVRVGPWGHGRWLSRGTTALVGGLRTDLKFGEGIYSASYIWRHAVNVDLGAGWDWRGDADGARLMIARLGWGLSARPTWRSLLYDPEVRCPRSPSLPHHRWVGRPPGGFVSGFRVVTALERDLSMEEAWRLTLGLEFALVAGAFH